jgi:Ca-activated chloride channel family protein
VTSLMIESLGERDRLELIEFGSSPRRWRPEPVVMTRDGKKEALKWVRDLSVAGGTEMRTAILEALKPLRADAQRQIVLVTDGYVGFEQEIVREVLHRLPRGSRLHTVGVGSGVNRTLTRSAARAGAGLEVVIGLDEDPERAAARLVARTEQPIVTDLSVEGDGLIALAPGRLPDLFAGAPVKIALQLQAGAKEVRVRGKTATGYWEGRAAVEALSLGAGNQAIAALFARELVEDREAHIAGGGDQQELDREIERLGLDFQIATRMTSWIAITEDRTVDANGALLREVMPHEVPYGTSIEGMGLRGAGLPMMAPGGAAIPIGMAGVARMSSVAEMSPALEMRSSLARKSSRGLGWWLFVVFMILGALGALLWLILR